MSDGFWGALFGCLPVIAAIYFKHKLDMRRLDQQTKTLVDKTDETKGELLGKTEETKKLVVAQTVETKQVALASKEAALVGVTEAKKAYSEANHLNQKLIAIREDNQRIFDDLRRMVDSHEETLAANARHTAANKANIEMLQLYIQNLVAKAEQDKGLTPPTRPT